MKYSTKFDTDENPLSESGSWRQGGDTGLDWTNVRCLGGGAYGTEDAGAADFKDSIASLEPLGTWGWHQRARGTLKVTNATTEPPFIEAELLLHFSISANVATGYELTISNITGDHYIQINRWNGALGSFTNVSGGTQGTAGFGTVLANGDIYEFRDEGTSSVPKLTVYQNGIKLTGLTYDTTPDATKYTGGAPGVGFYNHGIVSNTFHDYIQWNQFDATDGYFDGELLQASNSTPSTSATSTTNPFGTNVTQGNLLVAIGWHGGSVAGTFSDTRGNSWSVIGGVTNATDVHRIDIGIATAKDAGASTVTYNHSGDAATTFRACGVAEIKSSFASDKAGNATGNSGVPSSGASGTTSAAFELLLGTFGGASVSADAPISTANFLSYTDAIGGPSAHWLTSLLGRLTYSIGTFTNSATVTSQQWSALVNTLTLVATQTLGNYRYRNDDGDEATATWRAAEQTNVSVANGATFRLRFQVDSAGDPPSQPFTLQYRKFGDVSWTSVSASSKIQYAASANIASGAVTPTTAQLAAPLGKTSASFTAGKISDDTNPLTGVDIALDFYSEYEFALKTDGTPAVGETYEFRLTGTNMVASVVPQISITARTVVSVPVRYADLRADVTLRQPVSTTSGAPMDVRLVMAVPAALHDVTLGDRGSVGLDITQVPASSTVLDCLSPFMTWAVAATLALAISPLALAGTSPAATWTATPLELAPQPVALSPTIPLATWTVAAIDLVQGGGTQALSGTSPVATWNAAAIELAEGSVALTGTVPGATWTAAAVNLAPSSFGLTGTSPAATWTPASVDLAISSLALTGTSPVATWTVAAINLFQQGALTGTSPSTVWSVPSIDLAAGSVALSGLSASSTWSVPALTVAPPNTVADRDTVVGPLLPPRPRLRPAPAPVSRDLGGSPASTAWGVAAIHLVTEPVTLKGLAPSRAWIVRDLELGRQSVALKGRSPAAATWVAVGIAGPAFSMSGPPPPDDGSAARAAALRAILADDDELVQLGVFDE